MDGRVDLYSLLTSNYHGENVKRLMDILSTEISMVRDVTEELSLQGGVFNSTWGLEMWERELNIIPHKNMNTDQRKQRVYAHINTRTPSTKRQILESLKVYGYDADVIEYIDTFFIKLILKVKDMLMFPLDEIYSDIDDLIPAHLEYNFWINYSYEVGIKSHIRSYIFEYDLCGTKPDISTIGKIDENSIVLESILRGYLFEAIRTGNERTGLFPDISTLGIIDKIDTLVENQIIKVLFESMYSGIERTGLIPNNSMVGSVYSLDTLLESKDMIMLFENMITGSKPDISTVGDREEFDAGAKVEAKEYYVEHILCGEEG